LRVQGHDEKIISQIIQVNAATLAQSMYGEEENSPDYKKLDGMRGHCMELAQEREMQMELPHNATTAIFYGAACDNDATFNIRKSNRCAVAISRLKIK